MLVLASNLMYYAERDAQTALFTSITTSMWWRAVIPDHHRIWGHRPDRPRSAKSSGRWWPGLGIAASAIPTGIMASAFNEFRRRRKSGGFCPHCWERLV